MRRYIPIALILIILFQSGIRTMIVVHFKLNKDYIIENLCENRNNPEIHCNGKCYLLKNIKKQETREQQLPSFMKGIEEVILFFSTSHFIISYHSYTISKVLEDRYLLKYYISPISDIFQPPQ